MTAMTKNDILSKTKFLIEAVRLGSLGKAGEYFDLSAPQISREISQLENDLKTKLLIRNPTGVRPTSKGGIFISKMMPLIQNLEQIEASIRQSTSHEAVLAVPLALGAEIIPKWSAGFKETNPTYTLEQSLYEPDRSQTWANADYIIDIAYEPRDTTKIAVRIAKMHLVNVASPVYLNTNGDVINPQALTYQRLNICPETAQKKFVLRNTEQKNSFFNLSTREAHRHSNALSMCAAVKAGDGVGIGMPKCLIGDDLASGRLVEVLPEWKIVPTAIWFLRTPSRYPTLLGLQLLNWFQQKAAKSQGFE